MVPALVIADGDAPAAEPAAEPASEPALFDEIVFHIIASEELPGRVAHEMAALLLENGAKEAASRENAGAAGIRIDFQEVTHIIATDIHFPGYADAERLMIPVVTPDWVRESVSKKRMAPVRPYTPDPRLFFAGVVVTVAELPQGDKEAICGGVVAMGGQYNHHLTKLTTHVVALDLDNDKCRQALQKKLKVKFVAPHWFDDCLKLGRRIGEDKYTLPNPEILNVDSSEHLDMPKVDMPYSHPHREGPMGDPTPPSPPRGAPVFDRKRVMLGNDLGLSPGLRGVIGNIITEANGGVTETLDQAHVYVCKFREGEEYVQACRRGLFVGNLTWLYWMFAHGEWINPLSKLLHYPIVKGGLPGMSGAVITVSNYGGDSRLYLESLIEAAGGKFTKSMKADNTHLITARAHSEKCTAAKEWNIHMVNHLWLEESYAKWEVQSLTNPRYTHFPRRTNLMEVVGQTLLDPTALEQFYLDEEWDVDAVPEATTEVTVLPAAPPAPPKTPASPKTPAPRAAPKASRRGIEGTSEQVPPSVTSSGRRAKEQAVARLHDEIAPDLNLYDKERKRKGGVMGSGRRRASESGDDGPRGRKRTSSSVGAMDTDEEGGKVVKKGKKRPKPSVHLLITAYKGWLDQPQKEDSDKRALADIGIQCVAEPTQCTHLAAPHIARTEKFCCALAKAPVVVSMDWVDACIREARILDTAPYLLHDPDGEARLNVNLADALGRASEKPGRLLQGQTVYCAPGVHGGYDTCRRIVEANGGTCVSFRLAKRPANAPDCERLVLLSGDEAADRKLWGVFRKMATAAGSEAVVYRADWLLDLAMTQRVVWSDKYAVARK